MNPETRVNNLHHIHYIHFPQQFPRVLMAEMNQHVHSAPPGISIHNKLQKIRFIATKLRFNLLRRGAFYD